MNTKKVVTHMPVELADQVRELADREGVSVADIMRQGTRAVIWLHENRRAGRDVDVLEEDGSRTKLVML